MTKSFISDGSPLKLDLINCNGSEDTSHYTTSDKKSPKLAVYYFKHEERDPSMENDEPVILAHTPDSSQNGFETNGHSESDETENYTANETEETNNVPVENGKSDRPKSISDDTIRILVQKAEELVSEKRHINKLTKVNKWLKVDKPDDSCDASCEDDEKESQLSDEDLDASTATLRAADISWNPPESSMGLEEPINNGLWLINNFSISESALHRMDRLSTTLAYSSNNVNANSTNSTSSTVEEVLPFVPEKTPGRKKKTKQMRKRELLRKSDTHLIYNGRHKVKNLIKSGSFPGYNTQNTNNESNMKHEVFTESGYGPRLSETSTTSGAESEEEFNKKPINFKYGGKTRYLQTEPVQSDKSGKNSLTTEEQSSSFSEQAWDNYQENYLSEPYSESHDSDAARKLLDFGEDYRKFIDSQSDWSAFSDISPRMKRKSWPQANDRDSNSDEESLKQLINDSRDQLHCGNELYDQIRADGIRNYLVTPEIDDLISTCNQNIHVLEHMSESPEEFKMLYVDKAVTANLLDDWRDLYDRTLPMEAYKRLHKQILDFRSFIEMHNYSPRRFKGEHCGVEDIYVEIDACNKLLESLSEQRQNLVTLNAVVHSFTLANHGDPLYNCSGMKAEISELYEMFDIARSRVNDELGTLRSLLPVWRTLESRLQQLQNDLKTDEQTIEILDSSLDNGTLTDQTAASVREVAKLLSETTATRTQSIHELITEGSYSDSGISDEGSEQEIGERQRRLAAIRRLVRQLEIGLPQESKSRLMMREKLRTAEDDLRSVQMRCRSLVARTSACSGNFVDRLRSVPEQEEPKPTAQQTSPGDPDSDPGKNPKNKSWFRRLFKTSLAFQLFLLAFVCLGLFFEPRCCDYMNNYSWTLSPKLHYEAHPPI